MVPQLQHHKICWRKEGPSIPWRRHFKSNMASNFKKQNHELFAAPARHKAYKAQKWRKLAARKLGISPWKPLKTKLYRNFPTIKIQKPSSLAAAVPAINITAVL